MIIDNLIDLYREFDGSWNEFVKELSKDSRYAEFVDSVDLQDKLTIFINSLPKESHCWKLIESYSYYRDKLTQDGVDWFLFNIKPLFEKLDNSDSEIIKFDSSSQIYFASVLLKDNVLPHRLSFALADTLLNTLSELDSKKYTVESLFLTPPKAGRKKGSGVKESSVMWAYHRLKKGAKSKKDIYSELANDLHVSDDTIRRIVERNMKVHNSRESLKKWLIDRCQPIKSNDNKNEKEHLIRLLNDDLIQIENDDKSKYHLGLRWHIDLTQKINDNRKIPKEVPSIKYIELIDNIINNFLGNIGKIKK
jgi:hypothetical protein